MPVSEHRIALPSRYRVVRHIANGGMASVWAAEDELLGRLVAVKVLAPAYAEDGRANRRFLREARAGARLSECRHVVTVYDIGEHESQAFMVMEHFAGGTIADRLRSRRPIPRAVALRWLREAAEALDCAHRHGVVHRDVKPANLLLDEDRRLAVGDFGIATVATEASVTATGQVLGTAAYISPEQARGEPATAASDRYALTVVAFELLTGRRPFEADHPAAQARAHVAETVPDASAVAAGVPPAVDAVLRAGMAKDPARRPSTAGDLLEALEDALDDADAPTAVAVPVAAREPARTPPPSLPRPPVATARRRWPGIAALVAIAGVAGAVIAIALGSSDGSGGDGSRQASTSSTPTRSTPAAQKKPKPKAQKRPKAAGPATPQATAADPVALNDQGFSLLNQGQAAQAVTPLERSVTAFRAQGRKGDIGYAYALYNLGNALRLSGRPADAIPYLQERLAISNFKRGIVRKELKAAQAQAA
jgi:serine/threonine-protein kinase